MSAIQPSPLCGRVLPAVTPVRSGGASGRAGSFGLTRFNPDGSPKMHKGTDLLCVVGWPVFAVHVGHVTMAGWENEANPEQGFGRRVWIESSMGVLKTVYAHLSLITVKEGDKVQSGQLIGLTGRSGNVGTDEKKVPTHMHFEVHRGSGAGMWEPIDPELWLMGKIA